MHFGYVLDSSDTDLLNTHLHLLDADIASKFFVCLQDVLVTSSRHVFKTSSRNVFKTSSRHVFETSWRRLQHSNFSSSNTSWTCLSRRLQDLLRDVLKTLLQDVFITAWKPKLFYAEDVLKTSSKRLEDQQMFVRYDINWPLLTCSNSSQHLQINF